MASQTGDLIRGLDEEEFGLATQIADDSHHRDELCQMPARWP